MCHKKEKINDVNNDEVISFEDELLITDIQVKDEPKGDRIPKKHSISGISIVIIVLVVLAVVATGTLFVVKRTYDKMVNEIVDETNEISDETDNRDIQKECKKITNGHLLYADLKKYCNHNKKDIREFYSFQQIGSSKHLNIYSFINEEDNISVLYAYNNRMYKISDIANQSETTLSQNAEAKDYFKPLTQDEMKSILTVVQAELSNNHYNIKSLHCRVGEANYIEEADGMIGTFVVQMVDKEGDSRETTLLVSTLNENPIVYVDDSQLELTPEGKLNLSQTK